MFLNDGTRIFAQVSAGESGKPVVVFIHGDGQNHTVWNNLTDYFRSRGHSVLVYDLPGHGLSEPYKSGTYSFSRFAETLDEVISGYDIKSPLLVGNSSGGMIALEYAVKKSIASAILISSSDASPTKHNSHVERIIEEYIRTSEQVFEGQQLFRYDQAKADGETLYWAALKYTSPEAIRANMRALRAFDIRDRLRSINVPLLALKGGEDPYVTEECLERFRKGFSKCKTVTLPKAGHHILLQASENVLEAVDQNYSFLVQE